jgi:hypothetical protein
MIEFMIKTSTDCFYTALQTGLCAAGEYSL